MTIDNIEDAIIALIVAGETDFKKVESHVPVFDEAEVAALAPRVPFCYVMLEEDVPGERSQNESAIGEVMKFTILVAASSLRNKKEGQRGCYDLLASIKTLFDGTQLTVTIDDVGYNAGQMQWEGDRFEFATHNLVAYGATYSLIQ